MFCKNCGNEIKDGMAFCDKCGTEVDFADAEKPKKKISLKNAETNAEISTEQKTADRKHKNDKLTLSEAIVGSLVTIIPIVILIIIIVCFINSFKFSVEKVKEGSPTFYTELRTEEDKELGELYLETFSNVEIGEVLEYCFDNTKWEYKEDVNDGLGGKWDIVRFTGTYIDNSGITQAVTIDFRKYRLKEYLFSKATRKQFCVDQIIDTGYTYGIGGGVTYEFSDEEIYYYLKNCLDKMG